MQSGIVYAKKSSENLRIMWYRVKELHRFPLTKEEPRPAQVFII